jgi:hypothetical protein
MHWPELTATPASLANKTANKGRRKRIIQFRMTAPLQKFNSKDPALETYKRLHRGLSDL